MQGDRLGDAVVEPFSEEGPTQNLVTIVDTPFGGIISALVN